MAVLNIRPQETGETMNAGFSAPTIATLQRLRWAALHCRTLARIDPFEACRLLDLNGSKAESNFAIAIMQCLRQGLNRKPIFHRINAEDVSFDESWLLRLVYRAKNGDVDSVHFLIASRVAPPYRRSLSYLVFGLAEQITQV